MKTCVPIIALLLAAVCGLAQQVPESGSVTDLKGIQKLEGTDAAAAKINDVETLASLWADDGVLIMPMSAPLVGRQAIRAMLEQQKQQSRGVETLAYDENWRERRIAGDQCFEWGTITVKLKSPNGKEATQTAYLARLLVRGEDGTWRFARAIATPAPPR